nr:attacin-like c3610 [Carausius morosus]
MKVAVLVLCFAVAVCMALPLQDEPHEAVARERRSPGGTVKVDVTRDDRLGTTATGQVGGTIWKSDDGRARLTGGAQASKRLEGGKPDVGGFVNFKVDLDK